LQWRVHLRRPVEARGSDGNGIFSKIVGRIIIDFGCGEGAEAVEMAAGGTRGVTGMDIREGILHAARQKALSAGVQDVCLFVPAAKELAGIVVSVDAFEHFAGPEGIPRGMNALPRGAGEALVSFGPTWHHPLGGHLFSVFPWVHRMLWVAVSSNERADEDAQSRGRPPGRPGAWR
jgi:SAM-dependent methyltransferase